MKKAIPTFLFIFFSISVLAQNYIISLWKGNPPLQITSGSQEVSIQEGILRISNVQIPSIEVYLPTKQIATGQAVVIFPGGGYGILAYDWEGTDFAKWLNSQGIAGIVVKYRLPISQSLINPKEVPLLDAQRALRLVRHHAEIWNIDPEKVGVMGFSAGGHLASTLSTQFSYELERTKDKIDNISARPDFSILVYPVITFQDQYTHGGSRKNLLGEKPSQELIDRFSNEKNVNANTPPTFLVHAQDDLAVPVENSLLYYQALRANEVSASLHLYPSGGHGFAFGMGKGTVENWRLVLLDWIKTLN
ncbi:MAG TPA: esterase [Algoriphagus sp.]|jgi:acetyl esterase/lipase|uniref:alpha/beta hydrolase n=1 Tax=unclassified Algoriphagus TaxID=2641541 RepID=UPI000C4AFD20|nr:MULTISPECIES: alpha/beta hydrolase [unclassified Algoriphagus]MAL15198.1 esterase [Algoriphagus sp.]QYH37826.1 alpha/beta hydrolase [Algoriphagus sp. NBT04N3]HAS60203.1 esterase [Algoriphagus sp.]HCD87732.1 esterase [Algoriphagus sp.]|tara:strand:+ start:3426 stop:4340 length:915 start_codon:yes stop_codon:yes gene_type:complete